MSGHPEIAREYVELRNFLAQSNPAPNMAFEVKFELVGSSLMAKNSVSGAFVEVAKLQPIYTQLFMPHYGVRFEIYSSSLIKFVNKALRNELPEFRKGLLLGLTEKHRNSLGFKPGYEPP